MRRRQLTFAAVAIAVLVMLAPPGAAGANPFPNNYDRAVADGIVHDYCRTQSFATDPSIADYAMDVLDATTDLFKQERFFGCANPSTDVWWWEEDLPAGVRGQRTCFRHSAPGVCDSSDVKIDIVELDIGENDWHDRRKTAVHELGHTIGLGHDTISVMASGEIPSTDPQWLNYSAHDLEHINAHY